MFLAQYQKQFALVAVLALLIAPVIGFSHAAIPHAHTHASDNALHAAIEHGLDNSLSRKDFGTAALVPFVALFVIALACVRMVRVSASQTFAYVHAAPLRRGVLQYRAFR